MLKRLLTGLLALMLAGVVFAGAPGPVVQGTLEGSTLSGPIPFSSGSGSGAVIASQQYISSALTGYLPLTGGVMTGPVELTGMNIHADGASILFKPLNNANQNQWRILSAIAGLTPGNLMIQGSSNGFASGAFPGMTIDPTGNLGVSGSISNSYPGGNNVSLTGAALGGVPTVAATGADVNVGLNVSTQGTGTISLGAPTSITGNVTVAGSLSATGNVNVQGTLSSTANILPAGPSNSGVAIGGASSYALAGFYDQSRSVNNRTAEEIFINGQQQLRFKSDDGASAIPWLVSTGGYASGITGIASSSGSGVWVHSGNFTIAGQGAVLPTGGNGVVISGTNSSGVPSITTLGAANNISMNIATKGGGGINLQSNTTVTGIMNATTAVQVNGVPLLPALSGTTGNIGGGLLAVGSCATGTATVTGATTAMVATASPVTYPGTSMPWNAYVSSAGVVTVQICALILGTPTATAYNVRVVQ